MRRKNGNALVKKEEFVLAAILSLHNSGETEYHGYRVNKFLESHDEKLVASTLYRILSRLEERGYLTSEWARPPESTQWRCMFSLTGEGVTVAQEVVSSNTADAPSIQPYPFFS